jgi:hypothetical protein
MHGLKSEQAAKTSAISFRLINNFQGFGFVSLLTLPFVPSLLAFCSAVKV